jgi:pimeloyl-ACP methyl ester carboxylesterase
MAESSIVFVHGSFFSAWTWIPVIERLSARGVDCHAVELPFTSLADDVAVVRNAIGARAARGPVTAVCHSYTGITVSMAGHDASHLVYVAARMPALGESQVELNKDWGNPLFRSCFAIEADGTMSLRDEAVDFLFNRTPSSLARVAMAGRRSMKSEIPAAPLDAPAWIDVPSSYLICGDDKAVNIDQQRMRAGWAKNSIELDCDHSPFFSAPEQTADFIYDTHRAEAGR